MQERKAMQAMGNDMSEEMDQLKNDVAKLKETIHALAEKLEASKKR